MYRLLLPLLLAVALPTVAEAQIPPIGGGMMPGRGMDRMGPTPARTDLSDRVKMPKSDELVSLNPLLRGITLTPEQKEQVQAIEGKYNPLILPALDVVRVETEAGKNGDTEKLAKYQQRANRYRDQEVAELRGVLDPTQLVRFEKNVSDVRARNGSLLARP